MPFVYFKFRSTIEYEKLLIESREISVGDFKKLIIEQKAINKSSDTKIEVKNAATDHIYIDDNEYISENSTLILRRVPMYLQNTLSGMKLQDNIAIGVSRKTDLIENNHITNNLHSSNTTTEEERIKAIMDQNQIVMDYEQNQNELLNNKNQKTGKVPVCYHCKAIGHVYRTCPLLTQQSHVKRDEPTHIFLKSQLGLLPTSSTHNTNRPIESITTVELGVTAGSTVRSNNIPDYLLCSLCNDLMEKAVLTPCCGTSFCDTCIQDYLLRNEFKCFLCHETCYPDSIIPNISLRKSILNYTGANNNCVLPSIGVPIHSNQDSTTLIVSNNDKVTTNLTSTTIAPFSVDKNSTESSNSISQPVMKSLATQMLQSLLSPLLSNIIPKNGTKRQWNNPSRKFYNQKSDTTLHSSDRMDALKQRMDLFKILELLCYTQKILTNEQFNQMKSHLKRWNYTIKTTNNTLIEINNNKDKNCSNLKEIVHDSSHNNTSKTRKDINDKTKKNSYHSKRDELSHNNHKYETSTRHYRSSRHYSSERSRHHSRSKDRKRKSSDHSSRHRHTRI